MAQTDFPKLVQVTQALYLRELQKIQHFLVQEAAVKQSIDKLDSQVTDTLSDRATMHTVGADMAWRAWAEKTRRELNMEMAHLRAHRLTKMEQVAKTFGQSHAVQVMSEQASQKLQIARAKASFEKLAETF
ncbi:MAG: hypothetical protein AB8B51_16195 [Sedimentitalea sp.]